MSLNNGIKINLVFKVIKGGGAGVLNMVILSMWIIQRLPILGLVIQVMRVQEFKKTYL